MKDLYQTLGLTAEASLQEIKRSYRKLALEAHPDRGGNTEVMGLLNEAYAVLSDPAKRRDFDERWGVFREADVDLETNVEMAGHLEAGSTLPYSQVFREEHQAWVAQFSQAPLETVLFGNRFTPFESEIYRHEEQSIVEKGFHDIFTFIREKNARSADSSTTPPLKEKLNLMAAVKILMDFLSGNYYGVRLIALKKYLSKEIERLRAEHAESKELLFFEGIHEIVMFTEGMPTDKRCLMFSIKKITDFAKEASEVSLLYLLPLFYNKYFRNLYAYALHSYWQSNEDLFNKESLDHFDGRVEAKELLDVLRERLSRSKEDKGLIELVRYVRLLFNLEKDLHKPREQKQTAASCREQAFHLLDWIPSFTEKASRQLIVNMFLQIGINFQQASNLEKRPAIRMADEKLAMKMYLTVIGVGHDSTPDVELYATTQALKYLSLFQFQDLMLLEAIPALQKRALMLADIFPFFQEQQPTVAFLRQENKMRHLMRRLLNTMIEILEYNKTHSDGISIDHTAVTILYQAYEACLKNWYQEEYNAEIERKFRIDLMEELLFENSWTFLEVDQNIDSPWVMVDRDEEGWMKPTRSLPYTDDMAFVKYRSMNGVKVNHTTGEITFFMEPQRSDRPEYEKTFTLFDLQEMLAKNLNGAVFSLDPVDPDKPYHPFNALRFGPRRLVESELLNTMLLTDYVLKFLTTHQEVQGQYPYEQKPVDQMISYLPAYLRKIIDDFHHEQHSGTTHRFWIEAEEIDVLLSDETFSSGDIVQIELDNLRMVVKKHRMERDIHGELKDVGEKNEGWPIYVLTESQIPELELGSRKIDDQAMIFIDGRIRLLFWEKNQVLLTHVPQNFNENLIRLYKQPRDANGQVIQNANNKRLLYRVTREMTRQAGLPHHYTPEFIFAHEFTVHYDEFAQYLPEFGRLRELSKISALIRFLNGMRKTNEEHIEALNFLLQNCPSPTAPPDTNTYREYSHGRTRVIESVTQAFREWQYKLDPHVLMTQKREKLQEIKAQIGQLTFDIYSDEVKTACDRLFDENRRINSYAIPDWRIRNAIDGEKNNIARQLSESKQASVRKQLNEIFSPILTPSLGSQTVDQLINDFMWREIDPLAEALVNHERAKAKQEIQEKQFPTSSTSVIARALDGSDEAVASIAEAESQRQLRKQKAKKEAVEEGLVQIGLEKGEEDEEIDLTGQCFWVPASIRHKVQETDSAFARYSFFVYGGVNIQPKLNVKSGGGSLGGSPVGSSALGGGGLPPPPPPPSGSSGGSSEPPRKPDGGFDRRAITSGFQSHHIIPKGHEETKNHLLLEAAGFNVHSRLNRIFLPKDESSHPTRSIHSGNNTDAYVKKVSVEMNRIYNKGQAEDWSQAQYRAQLRTMLSEFRQDLKAGNIALNSKCRPWAK